MKTTYCQSCGMPLTKPEEQGTEKDGSLNPDYCIYCYREGEFTKDVSMEDMIDQCMKFLGEFNKDSGRKMSPDEARAEMRRNFPLLKRWRRKESDGSGS